MPFEGWAILEIMGHRTLAGYVREVDMFGAKMAQIDVPELPAREERKVFGGLVEKGLPAVPAFTQFYSGAAVFSTTPTTEEVARATAERMRMRETVYDLAPRALEASAAEEDDDHHMDAGEGDENDRPDDGIPW